jgi:hypothetical protein
MTLRNNQGRKAFVHVRKSDGSAVVEAACAITILIATAYPLFIFLSDMFAQLVLQTEVATIAAKAAQVGDAGYFWLGQPRPGFDAVEFQKAQVKEAFKLCKKAGLPVPSVSDSMETISSENHDGDYDLITCDVTVTAPKRIPFRLSFFGFDFGAFFSGTAHARGVAVHPRIKPYALVHLDAPHIKDESHSRPFGFNQRDVAVIPVYGFFHNPTGQNGGQVTPYGAGIAENISPEQGFSMNHFHMQRAHIEGALAGTPAKLSSWNSLRRINNVEQNVSASW